MGNEPRTGTRYYFVDEAGDTTLFDAKGRRIVGSQGVSRAFLVGVAEIDDVDGLGARLNELRRNLVADPYFRNIPSMKPEAGKTALAFHAKDDLPEVRREVFKLLATAPVKVQVVMRRKSDLVTEARFLHRRGLRLQATHIYDDLVKRLFKNLLHRGDSHEICFARRGKSDRQEALVDALSRAQVNFQRQWRAETVRPFTVRSSVPSQDPGLQIVDYFLWAVQRLFERREDRFYMAIADRYSLIMDLDDKSTRPYGEWYSSRNPLTLEKAKPLES